MKKISLSILSLVLTLASFAQISNINEAENSSASVAPVNIFGVIVAADRPSIMSGNGDNEASLVAVNAKENLSSNVSGSAQLQRELFIYLIKEDVTGDIYKTNPTDIVLPIGQRTEGYEFGSTKVINGVR